MKRPIFVAGLLSVGLMAGAVRASDDCVSPMSTWQPREAMQATVEAMGWTVERIRTDDGCYKVYARDANGVRIKAKFDPATFALIKMETGPEDKAAEKHDEADDPNDPVPDSGG